MSTGRARVVLLLAGLAATPAAQSAPAIPLAIVRADGALIPFATFDGAAWHAIETLYGDGEPARRLPATLPAEWWFWPKRGGDAIPLKRLRNAFVDSHCGTIASVVTDLVVQQPSDTYEWPLDKLGIAVGHNVNAAPPRDASTGTRPLDRRALELARDTFNSLEREMLLSLRGGARATLSDEDRERTPPDVMLHEHADTYNFSATRRYPALDRECPPATYATGWLYVTDTEVRISDMEVAGTGCGGESFRSTEVLGMVPLPGSDAWVLQEVGYESEAYQIIDVRRGSIRRVLDVGAGGC